MMLFLYEWKKLLKRKMFMIGYLALLILDMAIIVIPYMKDYKSNSELNETRNYYSSIINHMEIGEAQNKIINLKMQLINNDRKPYSGIIDGDIAMLNQIHEDIKEKITLTKNMEKYTKKLYENIQYFNEKEQKEQVAINKRLYRTYQSRILTMYNNQIGWENLLAYQSSVVLLFMIIFLALPLIWNKEKEDEMLVLLLTTIKGKKTVYISKLLFALSFICFTVFAFSICEAMTFGVLYGIEGAELPVYGISEYAFSTLNITNLGLWLYMMMTKALVFSILGICILFLSEKLSNPIMTTFISGIFLLSILIISEAGFINGNPIGLIYYAQTVNSRNIIYLFQRTFTLCDLYLIVDVIVLFILIMFYHKMNRRKKYEK